METENGQALPKGLFVGTSDYKHDRGFDRACPGRDGIDFHGSGRDYRLANVIGFILACGWSVVWNATALARVAAVCRRLSSAKKR